MNECYPSVEYRYQYDDIGNRISSHDLGTNRTYMANNLNQYTSISNSVFSASPREEFTPQFDDDGNKNVSEVLASDGALAAHYEYAPFGALSEMRGTSAVFSPWRFSSEYAEDDLALVCYNYRHYEPETGRWMSRDPSGEQRFQSLMSFILNSPISCFDLYGLECKKVNGTGVDLTASGSLYAGFGGSISISISSMVYNCCCDGRILSSDAYDVSITISGSVGLGIGGRVNLPVIGSIGMESLGPQFTVSGGTSYSKECGDEEPEFSVTLVDVSGDIGGSVAIGYMFGSSLSYWAKYSISVIGEIHGRQTEFSVKYGWHGGGVWTINTPAGNINKEFSLFDGQKELGETPITVEW